jgi:hypothetical protein
MITLLLVNRIDYLADEGIVFLASVNNAIKTDLNYQHKVRKEDYEIDYIAKHRRVNELLDEYRRYSRKRAFS